MLIRHLFNLIKEIQEREEEEERRWGGGGGGVMYRYLHVCKVSTKCGMLQVADPRPASEELAPLCQTPAIET